MPRYDYRCRACGETFEVLRSMTSVEPVTCPGGHDDTTKLLPTVALTGRGALAQASGRGLGGPAPTSRAGGGCCGGACGCG
jgi:putative FmdB family regulatory protein